MVRKFRESMIKNINFKRLNWKYKIEFIIFNIRWILIPFYLKLFLTLCHLLIAFYKGHVTLEMQLKVLEDIDIVMIANLVKMVTTGSYNSFVSKAHVYKNENNSSGQLKIKTMTSLLGICSIAMLKNYLEIGKVSWEEVYKQGFIFGLFTISAIVLAVIDLLHVKGELMEHKGVCEPEEDCEHK